MTEKEKMIENKLYDANEKKLVAERLKAKDLCYKYNQIIPSNRKEQEKVLKQLLGKTKESILIEAPFYCDYGINIEVGENFYANHNLVLLDAGKIKIGDNVLIGPNCSLYTSYHPEDIKIRNKGLEYASNITIGNNVWIGGNVTILPGITIGDNVIIGAGSVVTKDVKENLVVAGNPAKVIKRIESQEIRNI